MICSLMGYTPGVAMLIPTTTIVHCGSNLVDVPRDRNNAQQIRGRIDIVGNRADHRVLICSEDLRPREIVVQIAWSDKHGHRTSLLIGS